MKWKVWLAMKEEDTNLTKLKSRTANTHTYFCSLKQSPHSGFSPYYYLSPVTLFNSGAKEYASVLVDRYEKRANWKGLIPSCYVQEWNKQELTDHMHGAQKIQTGTRRLTECGMLCQHSSWTSANMQSKTTQLSRTPSLSSILPAEYTPHFWPWSA